jgi:hypothetical protein
VRGWVSGLYLRESAPPGTALVTSPGVSHGGGSASVPELYVRPGGEAEVRWQSGCVALYNPSGSPITAGSSCSEEQLDRSDEAVQAYRREQGLQ